MDEPVEPCPPVRQHVAKNLSVAVAPEDRFAPVAA
jgi:hypothetical protein